MDNTQPAFRSGSFWCLYLLSTTGKMLIQLMGSKPPWPWTFQHAQMSEYGLFNNVGCCVFRPAFGCCAHTKAGQNTIYFTDLYQNINSTNKGKFEVPLRESTSICMLTSFEELKKMEKKFFLLVFSHFSLISGITSLKKF